MRNSGVPLSSFSAKIQAQIEAQLHPKRPAAPPPSEIVPVEKKRLRQSAAALNRTEASFLAYLAARHPTAKIHSQDFTLRLANGVRYTPDFVVVENGEIDVYEVKGFLREDAGVKLKVAASLYSHFGTFYLVTRRLKDQRAKLGEWRIEEVLA